ncbi:uncharacterized protein LOC107045891 [Diachasma alloeum]|uniref:uncharacterized protein LOC107045891 n=1 Tax=Diachasma alloeum TaxID=454923 RepID=UPI0007382259|nr:uncharacterized protein LOC107045891 [Diachasma alloeum]
MKNKNGKKQQDKQPTEPPPRKKANNRKEWKAALRPNALIIRPKDEEKYSEILTRVKNDVRKEQCECVDKLRRTPTGDMLIVLSNKATDGATQLHKTITNLLGDEAEVFSTEPQEELEIKDFDEAATKEEVLEALKAAARDQCDISLRAIKSLRKAYGGTKTASVTLASTAVQKILEEHGKIKIEWVNCRIRRVERPITCFKCWHYGHLATKCNSTVDRSKLCVKCAEDCHKSKDSKKEPRCALCIEKNSSENCAHIDGCSRCPAYKEALQKFTNRRQL